MKSLASRMLIGIVAAVMTMTVFTSCSEEDNPAPPTNQVAKQIIGSWYSEYDVTGTIPGFEADDPEQTFTSAVQYCEFHDDGTGVWTKFLYDENDIAIYQYGSMTGLRPDGEFTYNVNADGAIQITMMREVSDAPKQWTVRYLDGSIVARDGNEDFMMHPATDDEITYVKDEDDAFHGGAIKKKDYNINEDPMMSEDMETTFNAENWWEHTHIYIYVGGSDYNQDIYDVNGKQKIGYDEVALPWNTQEANTHIPMYLLDNFTPENGWQLVLNRCGSNNIANNNFMAFYNKYTGILRFFYYVPDKFGVSASDHAWEIMLSDNLAKHSTLRYGVPSDVQLNKSAIGQNNPGYYSQIITPWANSFNELGGAVLNSGWWAFDVDMSQYRSNTSDNYNTKRDRVQLQLKAWQNSRVDLYGKMKASIDGEFKMPVAASTNSIWGAFGDRVEEGEDLYNKVMDMASSMMKADYWDGFRKGMDLIQTGANLCGFTDEEEKKNGQINMTLDGTIDMSGTISTPVSAKGLCSPVMSLELFNTKNTTFGQGIWNIKKNPVIYQLNKLYFWYPDYAYMFADNPYGNKTCWGVVCFFDPSSIEIELNPNAFAGEEIEYMKTQAVWTVRPANNPNGTADYVNALNLQSTYRDPKGISTKHTENYKKIDEKVADFLYGQDDKQGMDMVKFKLVEKDDQRTGFYGRGINDKVIIEPVTCLKDILGENTFPKAYEVTVTLTIKLKSMSHPIVMNRVYVPEIKCVEIFDLNQMNSVYKSIKNGKKSYNTDLYDFQLQRIGRMMQWANKDFQQ